MDAQLLGDLRHALAVGRARPPVHISLDGFAARTHRSVPSGSLVVEMVGMEKGKLSWQRGQRLSLIAVAAISAAMTTLSVLLVDAAKF